MSMWKKSEIEKTVNSDDFLTRNQSQRIVSLSMPMPLSSKLSSLDCTNWNRMHPISNLSIIISISLPTSLRNSAFFGSVPQMGNLPIGSLTQKFPSTGWKKKAEWIPCRNGMVLPPSFQLWRIRVQPRRPRLFSPPKTMHLNHQVHCFWTQSSANIITSPCWYVMP